jgi:hypothetical protein
MRLDGSEIGSLPKQTWPSQANIATVVIATTIYPKREPVERDRSGQDDKERGHIREKCCTAPYRRESAEWSNVTRHPSSPLLSCSVVKK